MEIIEFKKVLSKAIAIVDEGIKIGYFDENRRDELNNKLLNIIRNGIVYVIPGTAIYGAYYPNEKKLYFNAKVFKSEEEALVYILHEMKHGLDHYDDTIGFENNDIGVGMNEGVTQRFATDLAEIMLGIQYPKESRSSLGISMTTHLDEYQIEDKFNELFCIAMGISMIDFIRMQNDPNKEEFKRLIDKFNKHSNFNEFRDLLDKIYAIQEETWFDQDGIFLEKEKEPSDEQISRAMALINSLKGLIIKYALVENPSVVDRIKAESFMGINGYGEILRDDYSSLFTRLNQDEELSDQTILAQADYINYQNSIVSQISSNLLSNECSIVFVTEFRYDDQNLPKIVYFRKGDSYYKMLLPMNDDRTINFSGINIINVEELDEIVDAIVDAEAEFRIIANGEEYARILRIVGNEEKSQSVLKRWNYYLSMKDQIDSIRERQSSSNEMSEIADFISELRDGSIHM